MSAARHEEKLEEFSAAGHNYDAEDTQDLDAGSFDYVTRLEDVLGRSADGEEDEDFLYQGEDSQEDSRTYNEQLLGFLQGLDDETRSTDLEEERQVEEELEDNEAFVYEKASKVGTLSDRTSSAASSILSNFRPGVAVPTIINDSPKDAIAKPFVYPNVSRLRSFVPPQHENRMSFVSSASNVSPSRSHFSAISRTSSVSNFRFKLEVKDEPHEGVREAFRWTVLQDVGHQIYLPKVSSILGLFHGSPTVLAANGLICIGTDKGRVLIFDFKQQLKCVCGIDTACEIGMVPKLLAYVDVLPAERAGPVSALALSYDHTYIAVGHAYGHINLYDISRPQAPARTVPPTSLSAVASGRKEGHIEGTQILSLGFVGSRHTAIVSADDSGLAFYHSLGKVLFVEASDTLRILGKYPDSPGDLLLPKRMTKSDESPPPPINGGTTAANPPHGRPWKPRKCSTILAMASLPLGAASHPSETYNLIALLTPVKLVVVGLKPLPRTWFRCHREHVTGIPSGASKWRGCLAWFPSLDPGTESQGNLSSGYHQNREKGMDPMHLAARPVLAYSWDRKLWVLRVSETKVKRALPSAKNPGKTIITEVGKIELEEVARWSSDSDYLGIQWLNVHQLLTLTDTHLEVWDVHTSQLVERTLFNAKSLMPSLASGEMIGLERIAHSMHAYKGKIFLLGRRELKVGTLLSWADRILAFVEDGDFLKAIETTRSYFLGTAPGNRIGLPSDPLALRSLVGRRMRDLMIASARYAFAEERLTDSTHITSDGRGVDRTSLFEGLVTVCVKACIALGDFEFLFEDLFEEYDNACISPIFLAQLEPFILDGTLRSIPTRITQRLIGMYEERGDLSNAERVIWHIAPECLDINQAITLCRKNYLYDALIYVYTRSLHDFVTPVVELLGLVHQIQRHLRTLHAHPQAFDVGPIHVTSNRSMETLMPDAYKIYTYLADILSGLTYPSEMPIPQDEALQAKKDVYHFIFKGLSYVPVSMDERLILGSGEQGGVEETYPYVRLLLQFDAEAFLHTMDIAFEDSYFNEDPPDVDRLVIMRILLEVLSTPNLPSCDVTMLNIFIARNVPKYPQSIYMAPSTLHDILVGLAEDHDQSTREDRQLAAEHLLSVYTPHDSEKMITLFDKAGFFRILRTWHRQEHRWGPLISTYLRDAHLHNAEIFQNVDEVLTTASRTNKGALSMAILTQEVISQLLNSGITETAILIDKHVPNSHVLILETLGDDSLLKQFTYLRSLLEPPALQNDHYWTDPMLRRLPPSCHLDQYSRELYLRLLCQFDSSGVIRYLGSLKDGSIDWDDIVSICEQNEANGAVIWSLDKRGDTRGAFQKLERVATRLASQLGECFGLESDRVKEEYDVQHLLDELSSVANIGVRICHDHSTASGDLIDETVEDMWFSLLSSQIDTVQTVSSFCSLHSGSKKLRQAQRVLDTLRSSVQTTFASLMLLGSSRVLSFPRLFKRLVDSTSSSRSSSGSSYSEFRLILTGMLESYRSEGDLLLITNRLIERDLFTTAEELVKYQVRGSRIRGPFCTLCKGTLQMDTPSHSSEPQLNRRENVLHANTAAGDWMIQRLTGLPYHSRCAPLTTDLPS